MELKNWRCLEFFDVESLLTWHDLLPSFFGKRFLLLFQLNLSLCMNTNSKQKRKWWPPEMQFYQGQPTVVSKYYQRSNLVNRDISQSFPSNIYNTKFQQYLNLKTTMCQTNRMIHNDFMMLVGKSKLVNCIYSVLK